MELFVLLKRLVSKLSGNAQKDMDIKMRIQSVIQSIEYLESMEQKPKLSWWQKIKKFFVDWDVCK
jgi:hypothetical protein